MELLTYDWLKVSDEDACKILAFDGSIELEEARSAIWSRRDVAICRQNLFLNYNNVAYESSNIPDNLITIDVSGLFRSISTLVDKPLFQTDGLSSIIWELPQWKGIEGNLKFQGLKCLQVVISEHFVTFPFTSGSYQSAEFSENEFEAYSYVLDKYMKKSFFTDSDVFSDIAQSKYMI